MSSIVLGGAQTALCRPVRDLDRTRFAPVVACLYNGDREVARQIRAMGVPVFDLGMTGRWRLDACWRLKRLLSREDDKRYEGLFRSTFAPRRS